MKYIVLVFIVFWLSAMVCWQQGQIYNLQSQLNGHVVIVEDGPYEGKQP